MVRHVGSTRSVIPRTWVPLRILDDCLMDCALLYTTREGQGRMTVTSGAAQGSVLQQDLSNVTYDGLLSEETRLVEYADDVVALVVVRSVDLASLKLNKVVRNVSSWMDKSQVLQIRLLIMVVQSLLSYGEKISSLILSGKRPLMITQFLEQQGLMQKSLRI